MSSHRLKLFVMSFVVLFFFGPAGQAAAAGLLQRIDRPLLLIRSA